MRKRASPPVTSAMAAFVKKLLDEGIYQHQIAGVLGVNQGRISEIKTGKRHPNVAPANQLGFDF